MRPLRSRAVKNDGTPVAANGAPPALTSRSIERQQPRQDRLPESLVFAVWKLHGMDGLRVKLLVGVEEIESPGRASLRLGGDHIINDDAAGSVAEV